MALTTSESESLLLQNVEWIEKTLESLISPKRRRAPRIALSMPADMLSTPAANGCAPCSSSPPPKPIKAPLERAIVPACALELIHTYSLIHDDLPCMDDDDERRGKPTVHKIYGEGHAVLTGDFLLTYAFQVLSEDKHLSADQKLQLIRCLAFNAGADGMIGGQVVDLLSEHKTIDWETLKFMTSTRPAP